ncbi:related to fructosyl amino acid oxidase [Rhynchosporium agropyri]|uniref:Related to fructosyl amino acid oxidase n=1 Tax=Rhynchosporium agropyri TaxID=914238 RepID=A0A1E1L9Q4_9HELO|nr:related to fructosyl amino acid oxidase [Rhynchosporium agropyri]
MTPSIPLDHNSSILIIGAGTWGCSTALHLARRGYKNVTVLDRYELPSPISAGNDINKIMEEGSSTSSSGDSLNETLRRLATHGWLHDPVFSPHYHNTGYAICAHTPAGLEQLIKHEKIHENPDFDILDTPEKFRALMPEGILTGDFPNWKGGFRKTGAGWVFARGALMSAFQEASRLGVEFITGPPGDAKTLLVENGDVVGAEIADGTRHLSKTTILASGAQAPDLVDMKDQLRPTAWTLAHIALAPSECLMYKNLPVLFNLESGFFMEPDVEHGELKICDEHPGYCNWSTDTTGNRINIPFARKQIPKEAELRVREFLTHTMPHLAERPFSFARVCWCADTPDRNFLIDRHPDFKNLVLAVGGSGHGFMHITSVGGFIADAMEGTLDEVLKQAFRWYVLREPITFSLLLRCFKIFLRHVLSASHDKLPLNKQMLMHHLGRRPETAVGRDWTDVQDRMGGPNKVMDFGDVQEWTDIKPDRRYESQ